MRRADLVALIGDILLPHVLVIAHAKYTYTYDLLFVAAFYVMDF